MHEFESSSHHAHVGHSMWVMAAIMIVSGLLSSMSIWADKWSDVRLSVNDIYMAVLMTGWMLLFMGLWYKMRIVTLFGILVVTLTLVAIRKQWFVGVKQYVRNMIAHHSMAIFMTKRLYEKGDLAAIYPYLDQLLQNVQSTQTFEIDVLKTF